MKSLVIISIFLLLSVVAGARFARQVPPGFGQFPFPQFSFPQPGQPGTQTSFVSSSQTLNSRFGDEDPVVTGQQTVFQSTGNKFTQTNTVIRPDGSVTTNKQSGRVRRETKNEAKYDETHKPESFESKQQIPPQQPLNQQPNTQQQPLPAQQESSLNDQSLRQQNQPQQQPQINQNQPQHNQQHPQNHPQQQQNPQNHPQQQPNYPQQQQPNYPQQQQQPQNYPQAQPYFPQPIPAQQFPFGIGYFGQQLPFPQFGIPQFGGNFFGAPQQQPGVFIPQQGQGQGIQTGTTFDNRFGEETVSGGSQIITSNNGNYQITSTVLKPDGQVVTSQQSGTINNKKP